MAEINVPRGPIDVPPYRAITRVDNETILDANATALIEALAGVELGAHDKAIVEWLSMWESSTVATICSWLHRVREDEADRA